MIIIGFESSCDETAVSIIRRGEENRVLSEVIKSQIPLHEKYGGIVPEIASRSHYEAIDILTSNSLKEAGIKPNEIDLVSITQGPGLIGSLLVGLIFAKSFAYSLKKPIIGVDHILAHVESAFITNQEIQYPLIALIVSGGHTTLFYFKSKFEYEILSKTRDDAAGEVMDKVCKYLDLGYPGGPIIDKRYKEELSKEFKFTIPRMSDGSNDFSFSGYKTAFIRYAREKKISKNSKDIDALLSSFLSSIVDYLLIKIKDFSKELKPKSIIISGGVSRNTLLRKRFETLCNELNVNGYMPEARYCTDNATMIAWYGYEKFLQNKEKDLFDYSLNSYSRFLKKSHLKHK